MRNSRSKVVSNHHSSPLEAHLSWWRFLAVCCTFLWCLAHSEVVGPGALETWDESRFPHCTQATLAFASGDIWKGARFMVSGTQGRPGACVAWAPHIALFIASQATGADEARSTRMALAGNFLWAAILTAAIFEVATRAFQLAPPLAWLTSLLFQGFLSTSINLKHFYPYDAALAISLVSVVYALRSNSGGPRRSCALGVGASTAFSVYPGYYFVYALLGAVAAHSEVRRSASLKLSLLWFILGASVPLMMFEALAQCGGLSFAASLRHLSGTVFLGSYGEMLTFPVSYAAHGEGVLGYLTLGAVLLSLARVSGETADRWAGGLASVTYGSSMREKAFQRVGSLILWVALGAFIAHTLSGYYLHIFVWYRRLLHLFLPWVCILVVSTIALFPLRQRIAVGSLLAGLIVVQVALHVNMLRSVAYPRDLLLQIGVTGAKTNPALEESDLGCWPSSVEWRYDRWGLSFDPNLHDGLILRNFCSGFMPDSVTSDLDRGKNSVNEPLFSAPHYENIRAYQYDGMPPELRARIRILAPRLEVLATHDEHTAPRIEEHAPLRALTTLGNFHTKKGPGKNPAPFHWESLLQDPSQISPYRSSSAHG